MVRKISIHVPYANVQLYSYFSHARAVGQQNGGDEKEFRVTKKERQTNEQRQTEKREREKHEEGKEERKAAGEEKFSKNEVI